MIADKKVDERIGAGPSRIGGVRLWMDCATGSPIVSVTPRSGDGSDAISYGIRLYSGATIEAHR
jgi:hypothetical protein